MYKLVYYTNQKSKYIGIANIVEGEKDLPAIEYGIDANGNKIEAYKAISGRTYRCPYCLEEIIPRKGPIREDYFAHMNQRNRTPQQMLCPGYKGAGASGKSNKYDNPINQMYIVNGGIPIYLSKKDNNNYELLAVFPTLDENILTQLNKAGVKAVIGNGCRTEVFTASTLKKYRIRRISDWINIEFRDRDEKIVNVNNKWDWGIRGVHLDEDFFIKNTGARVAQHANIVVGNEYLFISKSNDYIGKTGIEFTLKGKIVFDGDFVRREYYVYSFIINNNSTYAKSFVQEKGYQLIEKSDSIVPLWPPASIEGKELSYSIGDKEAYLYHETNSNQNIYSWDKVDTGQLIEKDNIFISPTDNRVILLTDYSFSSLSKEIRFYLNKTVKRNEKISANSYVWRTTDNKTVEFNDSIPPQLYENNLKIETKFRTVILSEIDNFITISSKNNVEKISKNRQIHIILGNAYHNIIKDERVYKEENSIKIDCNDLYKRLLMCKGSKVAISNKVLDILLSIRGISKELDKLIVNWISKGELPIEASVIIMGIGEVLR